MSNIYNTVLQRRILSIKMPYVVSIGFSFQESQECMDGTLLSVSKNIKINIL